MEFNKFFIKKYPQKIVWLNKKLNQKAGFLFVIGWCLFPIVPTDLVCYVAGTTKMNYAKYILAVTLGEFPLVVFYTFFTNNLISIL